MWRSERQKFLNSRATINRGCDVKVRTARSDPHRIAFSERQCTSPSDVLGTSSFHLELKASTYRLAMPRRCVAADCNHQDSQLFNWPEQASLVKQWNSFVKTKRDKWKQTKNSVLCRKHFKDECFSNLSQFNSGFAKR